MLRISPVDASSELDLSQLAEKAVYHMKKQALAADMSRKTSLAGTPCLKMVETNPNLVPMKHLAQFGTGAQLDELLQKYDDQLAKEPQTFEDYFAHMHYAFTAFVLFDEHKVKAPLRSVPGGHRFMPSCLLTATRQSRRAPGGLSLS